VGPLSVHDVAIHHSIGRGRRKRPQRTIDGTVRQADRVAHSAGAPSSACHTFPSVHPMSRGWCELGALYNQQGVFAAVKRKDKKRKKREGYEARLSGEVGVMQGEFGGRLTARALPAPPAIHPHQSTACPGTAPHSSPPGVRWNRRWIRSDRTRSDKAA